MSKATNNIAKIRRSRKLSQQQLAEKVGAHAVTISNLERGEAPLTAEWEDRLSEALRVEPAALLLLERPLKFFVGGEIGRQTGLSLWQWEGVDKYMTGYAGTRRGLSADIPLWVIVNDNSLYPAFREFDAIRLIPVIENDPKEIAWATGRLGIVVAPDTTCVGYLAELSPETVTVDGISGPTVRNLKPPFTIFVVDRAVFGPRYGSERND